MPPRVSRRCKSAQSLFLLSLLLTKNFSRQFIARSATRLNHHPGNHPYGGHFVTRVGVPLPRGPAWDQSPLSSQIVSDSLEVARHVPLRKWAIAQVVSHPVK